MSHFYCFLIKRDNKLLIKGLSFNKIDWYLLPKNLREVNNHPELVKNFNVEKCLKQKRVGQRPKIKITKAVKEEYLNDSNAFIFKNKLLEKDNSLTEDSICNQIKKLDEIAKEVEDEVIDEGNLNFLSQNKRGKSINVLVK